MVVLFIRHPLKYKKRIRGGSSMLTAEAKAFDPAFDFIRTFDTNNKSIIIPDSFSVLNAMNHTRLKNPKI